MFSGMMAPMQMQSPAAPQGRVPSGLDQPRGVSPAAQVDMGALIGDVLAQGSVRNTGTGAQSITFPAVGLYLTAILLQAGALGGYVSILYTPTRTAIIPVPPNSARLVTLDQVLGGTVLAVTHSGGMTEVVYYYGDQGTKGSPGLSVYNGSVVQRVSGGAETVTVTHNLQTASRIVGLACISGDTLAFYTLIPLTGRTLHAAAPTAGAELYIILGVDLPASTSLDLSLTVAAATTTETIVYWQ